MITQAADSRKACSLVSICFPEKNDRQIVTRTLIKPLVSNEILNTGQTEH